MRVHQSNFRTVGFVEDVPIEALCELGVPVIDDVGSGWLAEPAGFAAAVEGLAVAGPAVIDDSGIGGGWRCAGLLLGRQAAWAARRRA